MLEMGSSYYNISYHPILDNYPAYDNVTRTTFNEALKFNFAWLIETGNGKVYSQIRFNTLLMVCSPPGVFEAVHQRDIRGGGGHLLPQRPRGAGGHERGQHHQPHDGAVQQDRQVRDGACTIYRVPHLNFDIDTSEIVTLLACKSLYSR